MSVHYNKQSLLEKHKKQAEQELAKRVVEGGGGDHPEQYREITGEVL
jgi:hypothetical protein